MEEQLPDPASLFYSDPTFMIKPRNGFNLILAIALAGPTLIVAQQNASGSHGIFTGSNDLGVTLKGSTVFDPISGSYQVTGGGADMWGGADALHLSWVQFAGDATLAADVHFPADAIPMEKAVLIVRQSLDPASAYADVAIHGDGHITLQYRTIPGGKTEDQTAAEHGSRWLRIERHGDQFTAYSGPADGKLVAFASTTVVMKGPVYVGIGVCAHNADALATATFSHVTVEQTRPKAAEK